MRLRPQDLLLAIQIWRKGTRSWSYPSLGQELRLSLGEAHGGVKRAISAGLLLEQRQVVKAVPSRLLSFLLHGVASAFFPDRGQVVRGMATSVYSPALKEQIAPHPEGFCIVWPRDNPQGTVKGESLVPLYSSVPEVAETDVGFYEIMSLIDVLRVGHSSEKKTAISILENKFKEPAK